MKSTRLTIHTFSVALALASIVALSSCDKGSCQTDLRGFWSVEKQPMPAYDLSIDSLNFFKGDSLVERYTIYNGPAQLARGVYYITDDCSTIVFDSSLVWDATRRGGKYDIVKISEKSFSFRFHGACDTCVITLKR